jgi:hypothetical protein
MRALLFDSRTRFRHTSQAKCVCQRCSLARREQVSFSDLAIDSFRHLTGYLVRNPG